MKKKKVPSPKRVQAQRKFAQGAYVPPSNVTLALPSPWPEGQNHTQTVYMQKKSAKRFLDQVSLQNLHTHTKPVVVLERLPQAYPNEPKLASERCEIKKNGLQNGMKIKRLKKVIRKRTKTIETSSEEEERPLKYLKLDQDRMITRSSGVSPPKELRKRNELNTDTKKRQRRLSVLKVNTRFSLRKSTLLKSTLLKKRGKPSSENMSTITSVTSIPSIPTVDYSLIERKRQQRKKSLLKRKLAAGRIMRLAKQNLAKQTLAQQKLVEKELAQKELAQKELAQKELAQKELAQKELAQKELAQKELAQQKLAKQKEKRTAGRIMRLTKQNLAKQTLAQQKLVEKELARKEWARKELARKELALKELAQKELAQQKLAKQKEKRTAGGNTSKDVSNEDSNRPPPDNAELPALSESGISFDQVSEFAFRGFKMPEPPLRSILKKTRDVTAESVTTSELRAAHRDRPPLEPNNMVDIESNCTIVGSNTSVANFTIVNGSSTSVAVVENDNVRRDNFLYGPMGIEDWIRNANDSPCSARSMTTFRDVVRSQGSTRCHRCKHCDAASKVEEIYRLLQSRKRKITDVYEFDATADGASEPPPLFVHRQQQQAGHTSAVYIDVFDDYNHLVEISLPEQGSKDTMKARLIARPKSHENRDFPLEGNEHVLDQVLEMLKMSMLRITDTESKIRSMPGPSTEPAPRERETRFPNKLNCKTVEAPTFHLTEEEFNNPLTFFEKIAPTAAKFGICKVVAPESFQPSCLLTNEMRFTVSNQYIARLYSRWGPASREISAMKAYLAAQKVFYNRFPLVDGMEINLPKLYHVVQSLGGLEQVIEKKKWSKVAEEMRISETASKKLDNLYFKYILPYDTASPLERQQITSEVERRWNKNSKKSQDWAMNPLHTQKKLLGESDSSDDEEDVSDDMSKILKEVEDCIVDGRKMTYTCFRKVAANVQNVYFPNAEPTPLEVEQEYWRHLLFGTDHVFVNAASIDTGTEGFGFNKVKTEPDGKHPWNLKMLTSNPGNVLRSLGNVLGVTVPTLHFGMLFSTSCWHRDPHGLPWIEYLHQGPAKIWYGIPDEQSANFRKAVETLCPTSCQNKAIWLPSDITMIPPNLLQEHNVSLSHVVQKPGEYIIVFPKAYSCSISTGLTVSESVYFASNSWLKTVTQTFQELRESCEPTTFSLEQLLIALAKDKSTQLSVLQLVHSSLSTIIREEVANRRSLLARGVKVETAQLKMQNRKDLRQHAWNVQDLDDCQICRTTLYLSKVQGITGKTSSLCLNHGVHLLATPKYKEMDLTPVQLVLYYSEQQLDEVLNILKKRLFP